MPERLVISVKSEQLAWLIRRHAVEMTHHSGASHIASILSVADIVAVIYSGVANVDPKFPDDPKRDRVILSKGHAGAAIYAALAETGFLTPPSFLPFIKTARAFRVMFRIKAFRALIFHRLARSRPARCRRHGNGSQEG